MNKSTTLYLLKFTFILFIVFLITTVHAQLNTENIFKAPFTSTLNSQLISQRIIQNSEQNIVFIENLGQIRDSKGNKRPDILFLTRSQGVDMYITHSGIIYVFRKTEGDTKNVSEQLKSSYYRLDMKFVGMNKNFKIKKALGVVQKFHYYTPDYPNGISPKGYKKITIENIYEGINLVYYEKEGKMKYDFIVKAGADPNKIKMKYIGEGKVYLDKDGNLIVTTPMGEICEKKPYAYSRNTGSKIESSYELKSNIVLFKIKDFNKKEDIIIDPFRIWATYYGGSSGDFGFSMCTDNLGNLYITGQTSSTNIPIQTFLGAYNQTTFGSGWDAFILKFNSSGERLWATYYGGDTADSGSDICTDDSGNLYVTGYTWSTNFPIQILPGAYNQTTYGGGGYYDGDAFILKFNSSGARLWATYYGGINFDYGNSICTDNSNNFYVTGYTVSSNFPTQMLSGAYNQTTFGGGNSDIFILKFSSSCTRLWATFYGDDSWDYGIDICTDNSNNIYITGHTYGTNFPTQILAGAYNQTTYGGGGDDAFILKFNSSGERLWATYYGGIDYDKGDGICTDDLGNLYITGCTCGSNFPTQILTGAYNQTTFGGGSFQEGDAFILKFNSIGVRLWATYYGGSNNDGLLNEVCTDNLGNLYVTGRTSSNNFPVQILPEAYNQTTLGGFYDSFILKFNSSCTRLWASYYGGSGGDDGTSICTDNSGNLYVTGYTESINFPTQMLQGAYNQVFLGGFHDAFILKFNPTVDIKQISNKIPAVYSLHQNYPNPFNPMTNIKFDLKKSSHTKLIVYDILGKEITTLVDEKLSTGSYEVSWDGKRYPSGVYFYKLVADDYVDTKKMLLIK